MPPDVRSFHGLGQPRWHEREREGGRERLPRTLEEISLLTNTYTYKHSWALAFAVILNFYYFYSFIFIFSFIKTFYLVKKQILASSIK